MPNQSQHVRWFVGQQPPKDPDARTRWLSQSHQHMRIPMGPADRTQIFGTQGGAPGNQAAQEMNCWWNPYMVRYEATMNIGAAQYFAYAVSPLGPWSVPVKVLGTGAGGEADTAQQCCHYVEGGYVYLMYRTATVQSTYKMVRSPLPTPDSPNLTLTAVGSVLVATVGVPQGIGSCRLIKHPITGRYYMFVESQGNGTSLYMSDGAKTPEDLVGAAPLKLIIQQLTNGFRVNKGVRSLKSYGRPWPIIEDDGTWVLYGHSTSPLIGQGGAVERWICKDAGDVPANWTLDAQSPFLERQTALEVDQIADFQALKGAGDKWYAMWTGLNNNGFNPVNIFVAPMLEPVMAYDGGRWTPTSTQSQPLFDLGYLAVDAIGNSEYTASTTREHAWCEQSANPNGAYRFPPAAQGATHKVTNSAYRGQARMKIRASGTDTISGGNPIVALSSVGTTVTVETLRPHGLTAGNTGTTPRANATADFVTVTGCTPAAYNVSSAQVTDVLDQYRFTYTAGAAPGASTQLGVFDTALVPGETRRYRSLIMGTWVRD